MILAVDIGNTNIVIGCCENDEILFIERLSTNQTATVLEYAVSIKNVFNLTM
jgi:type III pantothenate kinase